MRSMPHTALRHRRVNGTALTYDPTARTVTLDHPLTAANVADLPFPIRVVLEITSLCNSRCTYCSQRLNASQSHIELEQVRKVIDEADAQQAFELTLRGAEATLHPDFDAIWKHATGKEYISANLITNGLHLNEEIVLSMLENPRSKIIVSLDGPEEVNSRFRNAAQYRKVMNWLSPVLRRKGQQVVVISTLYRHNSFHILRFAQELADLGLRHYHLSLLKRLGGARLGKEGFLRLDEVLSLEEDLDRIAQRMPGFLPTINIPFSRHNNDWRTGVPIPLFTEYHCGSGMKILVDGSIGISQMVHFNEGMCRPTFHNTMESLLPLGELAKSSSLLSTWCATRKQRHEQAEFSKRNYGYFLGFSEAIPLLGTSRDT